MDATSAPPLPRTPLRAWTGSPSPPPAPRPERFDPSAPEGLDVAVGTDEPWVTGLAEIFFRWPLVEPPPDPMTDGLARFLESWSAWCADEVVKEPHEHDA